MQRRARGQRRGCRPCGKRVRRHRQGAVRAGEAEVDAVLDSPGGDFAKVARGLGRVDVGASRAEGGGAAVAGSAEDVLYAVGAEEVVCDGMFATAGAENEDAEGSRGGEHGLERNVEGSGSHLGTFGQRLGVVVHGTPPRQRDVGGRTSGGCAGRSTRRMDGGREGAKDSRRRPMANRVGCAKKCSEEGCASKIGWWARVKHVKARQKVASAETANSSCSSHRCSFAQRTADSANQPAATV